MKLPVRLSYAQASLFDGSNTLWWAMHMNAARKWRERLALIPREHTELFNVYREMARTAGSWARQSYDRCVEEYVANG